MDPLGRDATEHPHATRHGRRASAAPRSHLLLLVYAVSLALLLVLAAGLAVLASAHAASAAIGAGAAADRALAQAVLERLGQPAGASLSGTEATARAKRVLQQAVDDVGLVGAGLTWVGVPEPITAGDFDWSRELPTDLRKQDPAAILIDRPEGPRLVESFPALADGRVVAVLRIIRDGESVMASAAAAQRDIAIGLGSGATVLVLVLFLIFRGAQRRLDRQTAELLESIRRDSLTGLLTHGATIAVLAETLHSESQAPVSVALVDIDNFRRLNDLHGHDLGDEAIRLVASVLRDAAGVEQAVGRGGPDEFLVVAPGHDAQQLAAQLDEVRRRLADLTVATETGDQLPITVSGGIAVLPLHGRTATELLSAAAMTLGEAKGGGGDRILIGSLSYAELSQARRTTFSILDGLINAVDTRDRYTRRHSDDVARYALFLAQQLGMDEEDQNALHHAAVLHDVGKIAVPDDVLKKPGSLSSEEMEVMKQHVLLGGVLVRDLVNAELVADGVRYHHERWDGTGYAEGLKEEEIPLIARIIAIADTYSAMTTSRPYRRALKPPVALSRLSAAAGSQLDPRLVDVFVLAMESQAQPPLPSDDRVPSFWLQGEPAGV